jgi:hypothetical protein
MTSRQNCQEDVTGFITRYGRFFHTSEHRRKYRFGIKSADRHGRAIHPRQPVTASQARVMYRALKQLLRAAAWLPYPLIRGRWNVARCATESTHRSA